MMRVAWFASTASDTHTIRGSGQRRATRRREAKRTDWTAGSGVTAPPNKTPAGKRGGGEPSGRRFNRKAWGRRARRKGALRQPFQDFNFSKERTDDAARGGGRRGRARDAEQPGMA